MKMKRYLTYVYKIIKVYLKEAEESTVGAYRTLIPQKNLLIDSHVDPKPTLKTRWENIISKSLQYFFSSENWHSNYNIFWLQVHKHIFTEYQ